MASLVWNTSKQQASPYERSPPHHASYQQRQQQQCERREREGKKYSRGSIYTLVEPERVEKLSGTRQKGAEPRQRRPSSPTFLINASTLAMQLSPSSLSLSLSTYFFDFSPTGGMEPSRENNRFPLLLLLLLENVYTWILNFKSKPGPKFMAGVQVYNYTEERGEGGGGNPHLNPLFISPRHPHPFHFFRPLFLAGYSRPFEEEGGDSSPPCNGCQKSGLRRGNLWIVRKTIFIFLIILYDDCYWEKERERERFTFFMIFMLKYFVLLGNTLE